MGDMFIFEGKGLEDFAARMRLAADKVTRETAKAMEEIGVEIREEAKRIVSQHSQTIPGSIKLQMLPGVGFRITGGSKDVPIGGLFELGNKGAKVSARTFRHPVFGNRNVWVEQDKHPYLRPARAANRRNTTKAMEAIWSRVLVDTGVKVEDDL